MVREAQSLDISEMPEVARLADAIARTHTPCVLRRGDQEIAVISPARRRARRRSGMTQAQRDAVLASVGGWAGLVDADELKRQLADARSDSTPPLS